MTRTTPILLLLVLVGPNHGLADDPTPADDEALEFMRTSARVYDARSENGPLELVSQPLLRWTNPVSGVKHGTFFVWTRNGRPEAAAQVFTAASVDDLWLHEFQSLSEGTFRFDRDGEPAWSPESPGVTMRQLPEAPRPADTERARLVQMRALARRFEAVDDFEGKSRWELRLMTKPLVRYGERTPDVVDGALFAFVHGTDPELLLLLEAREGDAGTTWSYGLAPMTGYALKARLDDEPVWSAEWRKPPFEKTDPFFILKYEPDAASPGGTE